MPSLSGWPSQVGSSTRRTPTPGSRFIPSVSGRRSQRRPPRPQESSKFLCSSFRAAARRWVSKGRSRGIRVSMPSVSGRRLQIRAPGYRNDRGLRRFYALGIGLAFAVGLPAISSLLEGTFLCPRYRAGVCRRGDVLGQSWEGLPFLCPRYRAGVCSWSRSLRSPNTTRFYALGIGLAFAASLLTRMSRLSSCFYALGIGLAFAAAASRSPPRGCTTRRSEERRVGKE